MKDLSLYQIKEIRDKANTFLHEGQLSSEEVVAVLKALVATNYGYVINAEKERQK